MVAHACFQLAGLRSGRRAEGHPDRSDEVRGDFGGTCHGELQAHDPHLPAERVDERGARSTSRPAPLGTRKLVLDQERRPIGGERRSRRHVPADNPAVRTNPLPGHGIADRRTSGAKRRHLAVRVVRRDCPRHQAGRPCVERGQRGGPDRVRRRECPVPHADQLEVRVAEEDEPVERAGPLVTAATGRGKPERRLEVRRGRIRMRPRR